MKRSTDGKRQIQDGDAGFQTNGEGFHTTRMIENKEGG